MTPPGAGARPSGLPVGDLPPDGLITVDLPVPASALAIGAHPDDIEFGCGATLARWAASGCRITHLVLTDGSKGSWDPDADLAALVADRSAECLAAAAVLDGGSDRNTGSTAESSASGQAPRRSGDRVLFLGGVDGELVNGADERRAVCRIIRTVRPAVVLGHDPWRRYRLHPDHRNAGFLTLDALVAARDPHFFPEIGLDPHRLDGLLLWEADLPNHVERAAGFEAVKVDALLCHHSQQTTTMGIGDDATEGGTGAGGHDQIEEFATRVRRQLAAHGALADLPSGEAFHLMTDL